MWDGFMCDKAATSKGHTLYYQSVLEIEPVGRPEPPNPSLERANLSQFHAPAVRLLVTLSYMKSWNNKKS